jgi:hypothetical protein
MQDQGNDQYEQMGESGEEDEWESSEEEQVNQLVDR